ncbi:MAG: ABC transporter substrate-binding protein [Chloroflexi bacterium]|nr:ABC transporter substrate-binding protein [Chloroflexota bacterium]MXX99963.1 ABC transporter substrate-binding protein [Chloroflexota bacterium]
MIPLLTRRPALAALAGLVVLGAAIAAMVFVLTRPDAPANVNADATGPVPAVAPDPGPEPGIFNDRVVFGQTAAFSGPAQGLGIEMRRGIEAAFAEANRSGGVNGRRLELVSLDDAYEPEAAITNAQQLIGVQEVFALIGSVGTPTSRSTVPVAGEAGVPFIAPFTGAAFLRDPQLEHVINLRASYAQETETMVGLFVDRRGFDRIGVLYQDDSFGRTGYNGARDALARRGLEPVGVGLYPRNTTAIKTALLDLSAAEPEAIILIGAYEPVGTLISLAKSIGLDSEFIAISFVGSNSLAQQLGPDGEGVKVTQVVPLPTDRSVPIVVEYLDAMASHDVTGLPGFVSLEGYLAGRLAIAGLAACGPDLSRTCFVDGLKSLVEFELGGFPLSFGPDDNQGSDSVFLTEIGPEGRFRPLAPDNPPAVPV